MAEDKLALIHRGVESVYNEGDVDVVDELYAPSVRINGKATDIEDVKRAMVMLREMVPGFRVTVEDLQTKGDKVAAQWTIRGRQGPIDEISFHRIYTGHAPASGSFASRMARSPTSGPMQMQPIKSSNGAYRR